MEKVKTKLTSLFVNFNELSVNIAISLVIGVVFAVLVGCSDSENQNMDAYETYEVNAPSQLVVRAQPSKQGEKILSLTHKALIRVDKVENGWAHIVSESYDGYVNADYIEKVSDSNPVKGISETTSNKLDWSLSDLGSKYLPFLILVLFVVYLVFAHKSEPVVEMLFLLPLSLSEIGYLLCVSEWEEDWFLQPYRVGWVMTIIDHGLLVAIAFFQGLGVLRAVRYSASGWFNNILTLIFSLAAGLMVYAMFRGWEWEWSDVVLVGVVVVSVGVLFAVVYYSVRDLSQTWKFTLLNMILVTAYVATVYHFAWPILVAIGALIFGSMDGTSKTSHVRITDGYGKSITLEVDDVTPYRGRDIATGNTYERNNNDEWIRTS